MRKVLVPLIVCLPLSAGAEKLDCPALAQALGGTGAVTGEVCKVSWARSDLHVVADGVPIASFMGVGSWAAFLPHAEGAMVMGDLALRESEVSDVMAGLLERGFEVSAVHSHFAGETPRTKFMHYAGQGAPGLLAAQLKEALAPTRVPPKGPTVEPTVKPAETIDCAPLEKLLGKKGEVKAGVCKITLAREDLHVTVGLEEKMAMPSGPMGITTWAAFESFGPKEAVVVGDFATTERELNPVLRELLKGGIHILVVHNHMIEEQPRVMFFHYWGRGEPTQLATTLAAGLAHLGKHSPR
jgi:hypothetical protein